MDKQQLKRAQDKWFLENAPFGKQLGYPDCCIREFCAQPPELLAEQKPTETDRQRFDAGCINGRFTGFIPCAAHAQMVLKGRLTLFMLIRNRNPTFPPFPEY